MVKDESGHVRKMAGMTKGGKSSVSGKGVNGNKLLFAASDGARDAGTRRFDVRSTSLSRSRKI